MKRRGFIVGLGSAAAWPVVARAQPAERIRRIGVLMSANESDPVWKPRVSAFTQALADLGWTDGRAMRMDVRWCGGDTNRIRALAQSWPACNPTSSRQTGPRRPLPSSGRHGQSRSSLRAWAIPSAAASSLGSTARVGTSPASPPTKPRSVANGLSCCRRSRLG